MAELDRAVRSELERKIGDLHEVVRRLGSNRDNSTLLIETITALVNTVTLQAEMLLVLAMKWEARS